jgi:peptidoglycan biosynthesis protein MviN/MurJ (putative lipid II flippase)
MKGFWTVGIFSILGKLLTYLKERIKINVVGIDARELSQMNTMAERSSAVVKKIFIDGSFSAMFNTKFSEYSKKDTVIANRFATTTIVISFLISLIMSSALSIGFYYFSNTSFAARFFLIQPSWRMSFLKFIIPSLFTIPILVINTAFTVILNSNAKFFLTSSVSFITSTIAVIFMFFTQIKYPIASIVFSYYIMYIIQILVFFPNIINYLDFSQWFYDKEFFSNLSRTFFTQAFIPISDFITIIMAGDGATYLNSSYKLVYIVSQVINQTISTVITPVLAKDYHSGQDMKIRNSHIITATIMAILPLVFLMADSVKYLLPPERIGDTNLFYKVLFSISLCLLPWILDRSFSDILHTTKKSKSISWISTFYGTIHCVLSYIFSLKYGVLGIAIGGTVSYYIKAFLLLCCLFYYDLISIDVKSITNISHAIVYSFVINAIFGKFSHIIQTYISINSFVCIGIPIVVLYGTYLYVFNYSYKHGDLKNI